MEVESKYTAPTRHAFDRLASVVSLADYHLEPLPPFDVRDTYYDSPQKDLLGAGYVLRVRHQRGQAHATIKNLNEATGAVHKREELELHLEGRGLQDLPEGTFRSFLAQHVDLLHLQKLLDIHQTRLPRGVFDGERLVGVLTFDRVVTPQSEDGDVTYEVELELAHTGREADLYLLDPVLRSLGLEPETKSKFERRILQTQTGAYGSLVILPHEKERLKEIEASGLPLHRRRAHVILLAGGGLRPTTIANKVGLSPGRVVHWIEEYRAHRVSIFADDVIQKDSTPLKKKRRFNVSELISTTHDVPALFPDESTVQDRGGSFDSEGWTIERFRSPESGDGVVIPEKTSHIEPADLLFDEVGSRTGPGSSSEGTHVYQPLETDDPEQQSVLNKDETVLELDAEHHTDTKLQMEQSAASLTVYDEAVSISPNRPVVETSPDRQNGEVNRLKLKASDPILVACSRLLKNNITRFLEAKQRACLEDSGLTDARKALLSAHRIRITLKLFEPYLPSRPTKALHSTLGLFARPLDQLCNSIQVDTYVQSVWVDESTAGPATASDALRTELEHTVAEKKAFVVDLLESDEFGLWEQRLRRLITYVDDCARQDVKNVEQIANIADDYLDSVDNRPHPAILGHFLGSRIWTLYEHLQAYGQFSADAPADVLRRLGLNCATLQYLIGLVDNLPELATSKVTTRLAALEGHLSMLYKSHFSQQVLKSYPKHGVDVTRRRLATVESEIRREAPVFWAKVTSRSFKKALATVVSAL